MEIEQLLSQLTHLIVSLVIVLQITPWVLLFMGFFIMRHLNQQRQTHAPTTTVRTTERR